MPRVPASKVLQISGHVRGDPANVIRIRGFLISDALGFRHEARASEMCKDVGRGRRACVKVGTCRKYQGSGVSAFLSHETSFRKPSAIVPTSLLHYSPRVSINTPICVERAYCSTLGSRGFFPVPHALARSGQKRATWSDQSCYYTLASQPPKVLHAMSSTPTRCV